uniref:Putative cdk5 activator-binding protein n=1 Tax=Tabanus bromius TaxID=304241 RepID=A0A0K8TRB8_TABBR
MNEADIPIDIHTGKLQEWLVSRRIVPKVTQNQIRDIRNKIGNAVKDMPAHEDLIKLLSGAHINYFHCLQIVEILKQTEKDTKSVFGTYGSQRMKDWQDIVKSYERENVYLAEASQLLVRNITYELPGLKKQMARLDQQSDEALKRVQDLAKTETVLLHEHAALCQQLGIKGEHLAKELATKLKDLPEIYAESIKDIDTLSSAVDYYREFTENSEYLPLIKFLTMNGNATVYQYLYKEAPVKIEEQTFKLNLGTSDSLEKSSSGDNEIDFLGLDSSTDPKSDEIEAIDFGDLSTENIDLQSGDIDWGETDDTTSAQEIDFDISLDEYGIVVEGVGMDGGLAKGEEAYTILDSPKYRDLFIDELYELESFLKLRIYELTSSEKGNFSFSFMGSLSSHDKKSVDRMLSNVESIIKKVTNEQTQHLYQLKHSPKYASILTSKLEKKLQAVDKTKATREILKTKSADLNKQKLDLKPLFDRMVQQTRVLQGQIEKDISKRYKNRVVNLLGGVNSI